MTAISEVVNWLNDWNDFQNKYNFTRAYSYYIPENVPVDQTKNELYVTDVSENPTGYGSDYFNARDTTIQLNIFYGTQNKVSQDEIENAISSFLFTQNYKEQASNGRYKDPETGQITKVLRFKKERGL